MIGALRKSPPVWLLEKLIGSPVYIRAALCGGTLIGMLTMTLWPFRTPKNEVTWVADRPGLRFGEYGTVLSDHAGQPASQAGCSVDMWLKPSRPHLNGALLAFYGPKGPSGLSLHHSRSDLRLDINREGKRIARAYADNIFSELSLDKPFLLTVVSGGSGTFVYVNGLRSRSLPNFRPSFPLCAGRFVLCDSPTSDNTWRGELSGLSIRRAEDPASRVLDNYRSWKSTGRPAAPAEPGDSIYLFTEGSGTRIRDSGPANIDLFIPELYTVVQHSFLQLPWESYDGNWSDVADIAFNILGFGPFGFWCAALANDYRRRFAPGRIALTAGFLVSLIIEVAQSYLPTRNSDLSDVITNTIGSGLGYGVFEWFLGWILRDDSD
jgi:VanZ family protein